MPYRAIQWARRSIEGRQVEADGSRLLNFYAVTLPAPEESKVPVMLYSSPGLRRWLKVTDDTTEANRASASDLDTMYAGVHAMLEIDSVIYGHRLIGLANGNQFFDLKVGSGADQLDDDYDPFVAGDAIDEIGSSGIGTLIQWTGEAQEAVPEGKPGKLVTDDRRILWVSESEVYVYDFGATGGPAFQSVVAPVPADLSTLEDLPEQDWVDCEWVDGFFLLFAASGQFWHSNVDSIQFDQLDFSQAGDMPDQIVAGVTLNSRLYIIGSKSVENWYNAGLADFAFARDNSFTVNVGCVSRATIAKNPIAITFLGNDLIVYMLGGGQPQRVSTESVEYDIKRSEPGKARAFVYQEEGHYFYSLTLENADATKKNWTPRLHHGRLAREVTDRHPVRDDVGQEADHRRARRARAHLRLPARLGDGRGRRGGRSPHRARSGGAGHVRGLPPRHHEVIPDRHPWPDRGGCRRLNQDRVVRRREGNMEGRFRPERR